jgi:hypothetical protein
MSDHDERNEAEPVEPACDWCGAPALPGGWAMCRNCWRRLGTAGDRAAYMRRLIRDGRAGRS